MGFIIAFLVIWFLVSIVFGCESKPTPKRERKIITRYVDSEPDYCTYEEQGNPLSTFVENTFN